jgi:glucokinase
VSQEYFIGVDLGGTNIRAALFSARQPGILKRESVSTEAHRGVDEVMDLICQTIRAVMPSDDGPVLGIGIGAPGPVDPFQGILIQGPNLPGWTNVPIRARLEERLRIPVRLGNDANLAALAEWKFGAGVGQNDLIYFTISTGIGGGIISGGRLIVGTRGLAGEPGHIVVVPDGPPCGCGGRGHLESFSSGTAIARRARELFPQLPETSPLRILCGNDPARASAKFVAEAAAQGDAVAKSIYEEAGTHFGCAVANLLMVLNPGMIILGGGVTRAGDLLFKPIRRAVEKYAMNTSYLENLHIVRAQMADDSGLFGALVLARGDAESQTP